MREIVINEEKRNFKGAWTSAGVYRANDLNWTEKHCLMEIVNLNTLDDGCVAWNNHFAQYLGIAKTTARNTIHNLKSKGYIEADVIRGEDNHVEKRYIYLTDKTLSLLDDDTRSKVILKKVRPRTEKSNTPRTEKSTTPHTKKSTKEEYSYKNPDIKENNQENTNQNNQECRSEKPNNTGEVISFPNIELNNNQWHWKSDKQYKDYIEKIMPNYICEIVHERNYGGKDADTAIRVLTKVISIFYHRYRINKGKYHPWYTKNMLNECITEMFEYGLSEKGHNNISIDSATEYIDQFFSHKQMDSDYHLKAFSTQGMLKVLGAELGYDEWEEYN